MKMTLFVVVVLVVMALLFKAGNSYGYHQGWSDAHCGQDVECEGGQE